jgi:hypothetical protein
MGGCFTSLRMRSTRDVRGEFRFIQPSPRSFRTWTETLMSRPVGASPIQPKRSQQAGSQACSRLRKGAVEA